MGIRVSERLEMSTLINRIQAMNLVDELAASLSMKHISGARKTALDDAAMSA